MEPPIAIAVASFAGDLALRGRCMLAAPTASRADCLGVASLGSDFQRVIIAWGAPPETMRTVVMVFVGAVGGVMPGSAPNVDEADR